eukprot:CAMPEP_0180618504 /NCGR_PEP_ID=MMETSP1037_2-20121125/33607_1 /TAXON_ID=632150 /ORGANISM="Azadinium spinosum, Strain 3D9" /LENGTH=87 /DNA_ID=CAMNT_0022638531 /DNA_START=509 /DNA_END=772 /DNA_ORIENTATION=-
MSDLARSPSWKRRFHGHCPPAPGSRAAAARVQHVCARPGCGTSTTPPSPQPPLCPTRGRGRAAEGGGPGSTSAPRPPWAAAASEPPK